MMSCRAVRDSLPEYAAGRPIPSGVQIAAHLSCCTACAAAERELRAAFAALATQPAPPASADGEARARLALGAAAAADRPATLKLGRGGSKLHPLATRLAVTAVLAAALIALLPWQGSRSVGAAVEAAVQRANTWHLVGWKLQGGQRVPWEIWGRRSPFFYREQLGEELNFDDGKQRIRMVAQPQPGEVLNYDDGRKGVRKVATARNGQLLALRLPSGEEVTDRWWEPLALGTGWRGATPQRESQNSLVVAAGHEGGMQGPYTQADSLYTIDKRTWLPTRYEHRVSRSDTKEVWVDETLRAEYDVQLLEPVTTLRLPEGVRLLDTLSAPDGSVPTENVQRARGLTLQVTPLAIDPEGIVLAKVSCWLGNLKLAARGTATNYNVRKPFEYGAVGQIHDTAFHDDNGRPYVDFGRPGLPAWFANGDETMAFAPLEPLPQGAPPPHSLHLNLEVWPAVYGKTNGYTPLWRQEFAYTLPLPERAAPIHVEDYLPPDQRRQAKRAPDRAAVEAVIADARAGQYGILCDFDRAIFWEKQSLALVKPFSNEAQTRRLNLADGYQRAGDYSQAARWLREVIRVSRQHPETWNYYAYQAQGGLKYMATHKPRRWARKRSPDRATLTRAASGHPLSPPR